MELNVHLTEALFLDVTMRNFYGLVCLWVTELCGQGPLSIQVDNMQPARSYMGPTSREKKCVLCLSWDRQALPLPLDFRTLGLLGSGLWVVDLC